MGTVVKVWQKTKDILDGFTTGCSWLQPSAQAKIIDSRVMPSGYRTIDVAENWLHDWAES